MNTSELYEIAEQVDRELAGLWDGTVDGAFAPEGISTLVIVNDDGGGTGGSGSGC